jgi:hypothetical protein
MVESKLNPCRIGDALRIESHLRHLSLIDHTDCNHELHVDLEATKSNRSA